eukprot:symbB.v1.2.013478.t1/scaffold954.1/size149253/5
MAAKGVKALVLASEAGRVREAQELFRKLQGELPRRRFEKPFLWNLVLKACVTAKDWPSAEAWFAQMAVTSARSYGKLVVCAAQDLRPGHGGPKRAESVLRLADRASIMIDVHGYGALLEGCAAAGDPGPPGTTDDCQAEGRAVAWLRRLQSYQLLTDQRSLQAVARSCAMYGEVEEASAWVEGTDEAGAVRLHASTLVKPERAVEELEEMEKAHVGQVHQHSYTSALRALAQQSDTQQARQLLLRHPSVDAAAYTTVISAFAKRKDHRAAVLLLAEMLDVGLSPTLATWTALLSAQLEPLPAQRFLEEMSRCELQPGEVTYGAVLAACARGNQVDKALQMLRSMPSQQLTATSVAYTAVIAGYARQAKVAEAEELVGNAGIMGKGMDSQMTGRHGKSHPRKSQRPSPGASPTWPCSVARA